MRLFDTVAAMFFMQITFFFGEDVEGAKRLLESNGIWVSGIDYIYPADGSMPGAVVNIRPDQYEAALQVLREAGIL